MFYLDHAAATPVSQKALTAMLPYFSDIFYNPSAPYLPAVETRTAYDAAKDTIARAIGARGVDLIITSGATESINLALKPFKNILISATEHPSVFAAAKTARTVKVDKNGLIDLADLKSKITPETELISVALANNELGTVQPLADIATIIKSERAARLAAANRTPLFLHSDASQGLNVLDINVARLGVDLLTLNAAKVYGPKGVGALWVSHSVRLEPIVLGGGQERGLRSGTENVASVVGFATALAEAKSHLSSERSRLLRLRDLLRSLLAADPGIIFLGNPKHQLVNFLPISIPGLDAERLIFKLEQDQVYVSTGAACAAAKGEKSHVLAAIGLRDAEIAGSLRLTLGKLNDEDNIKTAARLILVAIAEERSRTGS